MSRVLLLCFIHGFKGDTDTFHEFPYDLKRRVAEQLPENIVESIIYPAYDTGKTELAEATGSFLSWLKEEVSGLRKKYCETSEPPANDNDAVGVILVAHSMGGLVAADSLFMALKERDSSSDRKSMRYPYIRGILTFDTPYNGLSRSMFVYGGFSNYQKVSSVFNAMTSLSALAPAALSRHLTSAPASVSAAPAPAPAPRSQAQWKAWQLIAVRTGTIGAIAAGGVAAYIHRESIMKGVRNVRNLDKESISQGYQGTKDSIGQGLAYVNRGNVGQSFAWLSDHFNFIGALLKQREMNRRLDHLGAIEGLGLRDFYVSLGENGYWSGGYFVPERTFCAVPEASHPAYKIFTRQVIHDAEDEVQAHMSLFRADKHSGYEQMVQDSASLAKDWFNSDASIKDDPFYQTETADEATENREVETVLHATSNDQVELPDKETGEGEDSNTDNQDLTTESPIDLAAAASVMPTDTASIGETESKTYVQHLMRIAQQAGTGAKGWLPDKVPQMPNMPSMSRLPNLPAAVPSLRQASVPSFSLFASSQKDGTGVEQRFNASNSTAVPVSDEIEPQTTRGENNVNQASEGRSQEA